MNKVKFSLIFIIAISFIKYVYSASATIPKPIIKNIDPIEVKQCKSSERNTLDNCACPDQYYDDQIHDECQLCPYPCTNCYNNDPFSCQIQEDRLFVSLDQFISQEKIDNINNYLVNEAKIYDGDFEYRDFTARGAIHSKCIPLKECLYKNSNFTGFTKRILKISDIYWVYNQNAPKLQPLIDFIDDLDIFEFTGETVIIINSPGKDGVEHSDHFLKNYVSEFIWIRGNRDKQFYVIDQQRKQRQFFSSYIGFFDDKLIHNIGTTPQWDYSIRVNGKFKPWVREFIGENYTFNHNENRRDIFLSQNYLKSNYTESEGKINYKKK